MCTCTCKSRRLQYTGPSTLIERARYSILINTLFWTLTMNLCPGELWKYTCTCTSWDSTGQLLVSSPQGHIYSDWPNKVTVWTHQWTNKGHVHYTTHTHTHTHMCLQYASGLVHCVLTHNNVSKSVEGLSLWVAGIVCTMTFLSTVQGLQVDEIE